MKITLTEAYERATKGPLFIQGNRICGDGCYPVCGVPRGMSEAGDWTWPSKVAPINAAILVHARNVLPEVVEALKEVLDYLDCDQSVRGRFFRKALEDTLANAQQVEVPE